MLVSVTRIKICDTNYFIIMNKKYYKTVYKINFKDP